MKRFLFCCLLLNICLLPLHAQDKIQDKQQQATRLFYQGDMQQAIPLFEYLYQKQSTDYFYQYLLQCYVMTSDYAAAHKLIKQQYKGDAQAYKKLFDMAYIARQRGQMRQAQKKYESALTKIPTIKTAYVSVANIMRRRALLDWAEAVYSQAQARMPQELFHMELASLYQMLNKYNKMTDELLNLLEKDEKQAKSIRYKFQYIWKKQDSDSLMQYARAACLQRLQRHSNKNQLRAFLLWISIQKLDFDMAERQAAALDKRVPQHGKPSHLFTLTSVLINHKAYERAKQILWKILSGKAANTLSYYPEAWRRYLHASLAVLAASPPPKNHDVEALQKDFSAFFTQLSWQYCSQQTVIDYADFKAHYKMQTDSAIAFLEQSMAKLHLQPFDMAEIKLYMADLLQEDGQLWEASLLYSQIEKDFEHDDLSFVARYRNALLSLYIGEIGWAEAQLDVLKAATDKKVANDAMRLALFIDEAKAADTTQAIVRSYGRLMHCRVQGAVDKALAIADSLIKEDASAHLTAFFILKKAELLAADNSIDTAEALLQGLLQNYPHSFVADKALWQLIQWQQQRGHDTELIKGYYKRLITDYPASFYSPQAREAYRNIH